MRYLTLAADYGTVSLRDERLGQLDLADLDVPRDLVEDVVAWNGQYQQIVPMDMEQRSAMPASDLIDELDERGVALAERLADAIGDGSKVRYYSEGRLRTLP
jgi:hypothetical protein